MTMRSDEELFKLDDLWKYQLYLPQYNTHKLQFKCIKNDIFKVLMLKVIIQQKQTPFLFWIIMGDV